MVIFSLENQSLAADDIANSTKDEAMQGKILKKYISEPCLHIGQFDGDSKNFQSLLKNDNDLGCITVANTTTNKGRLL